MLALLVAMLLTAPDTLVTVVRWDPFVQADSILVVVPDFNQPDNDPGRVSGIRVWVNPAATSVTVRQTLPWGRHLWDTPTMLLY